MVAIAVAASVRDRPIFRPPVRGARNGATSGPPEAKARAQLECLTFVNSSAQALGELTATNQCGAGGGQATRRQQLDHQAVSVGQAQAVGFLASAGNGPRRRGAQARQGSTLRRSPWTLEAILRPRGVATGLSWSVPVPASM